MLSNLNTISLETSSRKLIGATCTLIAGCVLLGGQAIAQVNFDVESLKVKDRITLKSGATLYGDLGQIGVDEDGRKYVVFDMLDGRVLKLDKGKFIKGNPYEVDESGETYNRLVSEMKDTAEAHRNMAAWCVEEKGGKVRFKKQIQFHYERVLELDPNDTKVKKKLGYSRVEDENGVKRWVPSRHFFEASGYVKDGTGWIASMQKKANETDDEIRSREGPKTREFKSWKKKLNKKNADLVALKKALLEFSDEVGVRVIFEEWEKETDANKNAKLRNWYIDAMGEVSTPTALRALVHAAVLDPSADNRDRALVMLENEKLFSRDAAAIQMASLYLKHENNYVIERAGSGLKRLASESVILQLAESLVTKHVESKADPGRLNLGFGNGITGLSFGGEARIGTIKNATVLAALEEITGQTNIGYNEEAWQKWYVDNHTNFDIDIRAAR